MVVNLESALRDGIEPGRDLINQFNALSRLMETAYVNFYNGLVTGNQRHLDRFFSRVTSIRIQLGEGRRQQRAEHLHPGIFVQQNGLSINLPLDGLLRLLALGADNNLNQPEIDPYRIRQTLQLHYAGENYVQFIERFFGVIMAMSVLTNTPYLNILDDYIGVINDNPQLVPGLMAPLTRNQQRILYNIANFYANNRDQATGRLDIWAYR